MLVAVIVGADEVHLVIFDRDPERTWEDKIWQREEKFGDYPVSVRGAWLYRYILSIIIYIDRRTGS